MKTARTADSKKYNLYSVIHKYARHEINRVTELAGSIDFSDPKDRATFVTELENLFDFLDDHSNREDLFIHPLLKKIKSTHLETLEDEHKSLDADANHLKEDLKKSQTEQEWYAFYLKFVQFQVAYFKHLHDEETKIMLELQASFSNDSLHEVSRELMKDMPREKMIAITKVMLPIINHLERVPMYLGMKASMPHELFKEICQLAQASLSQDDAHKLFTAIGIKPSFLY